MTSAKPSAPNRLTFILATIVGLVTLVAFSPIIHSDFVQFDDDINIYGNPNIQGLTASNLHWMFTDFAYTRRYIPLGWLGFALTYAWKGMDPAAFHFTNLLLQAANAFLVVFLLRKVLAASIAPGDSRARWLPYCAALGGLLWAVHPLRVEAVAWASGHLYLQASFFMLLSLIGYLHYQTAPTRFGRLASYWGSVAASALSLLSYPIALAFFGVIVLFDFYPLKRFNPGLDGLFDAKARRIWLEKVPYLVVLASMFGITLYARTQASGIWNPPPNLAEFGLGARAMQAFYVWAYYVWKPWLPFHLSPVYTTLVIFDPHSWPFWLSALFVMWMTAFLVAQRDRWPWALALWACHLVLLTPTLGLTERPHYTSDRYDYLPGLLWSVAFAALLWRASLRPKLFSLAASVALVLAAWCGVLTFRQTQIWHNSVTLFKYMLSELGTDPYRSDIQWRLGWFYANHGETEAAVQQYQDALRAFPSEQPYIALAKLLKKNHDPQGALTNYLALLNLRQNPFDHISAAGLLVQLGRTSEAIAHYRAALVLAPDQPTALNNLAWLLATDSEATNRDASEALTLAGRACSLTGRQEPVFLGTLAAAYAEAGDFSNAVEHAQSALALAESTGNHEIAEKNRSLLQLYQSGRPFHETAKTATSSP